MSLHDIIAKYILGYYMLYNTPWIDVDKVLFPIHVSKEKHWILGCLNFKDRCIYVYNSLMSSKHDRVILETLKSYSILLPLFLDLVDFWDHRSDLDLTVGAYSSKDLSDPFDVTFVRYLPSQEYK